MVVFLPIINYYGKVLSARGRVFSGMAYESVDEVESADKMWIKRKQNEKDGISVW